MKKGKLRVLASLALAGLLLFGQSLNDPFHFDDVLIVNDANVTNPAAWAHFLSPLHLRQVTYFTFYLNHLLSGNDPLPYHLVNVALHIANAALLFVLLSRLLDRRVALIAAGIFLAHPIQTEAVMYVYQRSTLLACFFSLLALMAWRRERPWLALALILVAFEAKESALAVPLMLALYVRALPGGQRRSTQVAFVVVCILALAAGTLALLDFREETTVGLGVADRTSPAAYFLTQSRVIYTYLRLLVFPYPQSLEYDFAVVRTLTVQTIVQILGLLAIVAGGIFLARSEKWKVQGWAVLAFFTLLLPTSSVIPSADLAFEHRLYLPMLAFSVLAATIICRFKEPAWIAVPLMVSLALGTLQRGSVWDSDARLWQDAVQHAPGKARAWFNLGGAYIESDPARARDAYMKALERQPDFGQAHYNLGVIEQVGRNFAPAVNHFKDALRYEPQYWPAWNNLGNSLMGLGEKERARLAFERVLRLNPDHWQSRYNIAVVDFNSGRFEEAIPWLRTVLDWRPQFSDARYLLAESLSRSGHPEEAQREREKLSRPPVPR